MLFVQYHNLPLLYTFWTTIYGLLVFPHYTIFYMQLFHCKFLEEICNDKIAKLKIFYLKLDLIGEKHIKEYEDKSSEQFKTLSRHIMEEVDN